MNIARAFVQLGRCVSLSESNAFKIGNGDVWQFDSNRFIVSYCVTYQLVMLPGNYTHW